jgi:hypothetical protein
MNPAILPEADNEHGNETEPIVPPLPPAAVAPPQPARNENGARDLLAPLREAGIIGPELILPNDHRHPHETAQIGFSHLATTGKFFRQEKRVVVLGEKGLDELTPKEFRSRLAKFFDLRAIIAGRNGQQVLRQKLCSMDNAEALLACEEVNLLPEIQSVLNSPAFVEDENKNLTVLMQGYHKINGGTYVLSDRYVSEKVSLDEAVTSLLGLLDDFAFATPADKSRCLAGFISPALKFGRLLKAAFPLDLCEADQSQTGKGFRAELIMAIYDEEPVVITLSSERGVGSITESVSEAYLSGKTFGILDNLRGEIDCPLLESGIKGVVNRVGVRRAYGRTVQVRTDHMLWMGTSNRPQATIDLANRSCITSLRKQPLNYKFREYKGKGLLDHVKSKKDYYLSCIFTVVKTWHDARKPKNATDHDFREWAGTLDWIAQTIFKLPPLLDGHRAQQTRVGSSALSFLHEVCKAVFETGRCDERLGPSDLAGVLQAKGIVPTGCEDTVDLMVWARKIGSKMYHLFKVEQVLYVDEFSISQTEEEIRNDERRETKSRKFYEVNWMKKGQAEYAEKLEALEVMAKVVYEAGRCDTELDMLQVVELFETQGVEIPGCEPGMGTGTMAKIMDSLLDPMFRKSKLISIGGFKVRRKVLSGKRLNEPVYITYKVEKEGE